MRFSLVLFLQTERVLSKSNIIMKNLYKKLVTAVSMKLNICIYRLLYIKYFLIIFKRF